MYFKANDFLRYHYELCKVLRYKQKVPLKNLQNNFDRLGNNSLLANQTNIQRNIMGEHIFNVVFISFRFIKGCFNKKANFGKNVQLIHQGLNVVKLLKGF